MNKATATLLLATAANAFFCITSAKNTACINANGEIRRIVCDGTDITDHLRHRTNYKKCDCIQLDVCANITITAKWIGDGGRSRPGIGMCQTKPPSVYRNWVCRTPTRDKRLKSRRTNTTNVWHPAQKAPRSKHCHKIKTLPCRASMFWNSGVDAALVECTLQQCDDECTSCAAAGPGSCDRGMCTYGSGQNYYTRETRCNRKCRLDMLSWGWRNTPTTTGTGYMRLVDLKTQSTDIIQANKPGAYLALVDMDQCVFEKQYYSDLVDGVNNVRDPNLDSSVLHQWIADTTSMTNRKAALLQVGGVSFTESSKYNRQFSFAPYANVYELGTDFHQVKTIFEASRNCSISATFTGFNYGPTILESFVVNTPGSLLGPGAGC